MVVPRLFSVHCSLFSAIFTQSLHNQPDIPFMTPSEIDTTPYHVYSKFTVALIRLDNCHV